jgi:hypothetical protein
MRTPIQVIENALRDLDQLLGDFNRYRDYQRLQTDFDRWRTRVEKDFTEFVSIEEAQNLERLRDRPSWVADDSFDAIIHEHVVHLESLHSEVARFPDRFGDEIIRKQRKDAAQIEKAFRRRAAHEGAFRQKIENNLALVIGGIAITSFGLGFAAFGKVQEAGGWQRITKTELDSLRAAAASTTLPNRDTPAAGDTSPRTK